jgi:hypothetical protein
MQENLEKNCDYLHELTEKPLDPYLDPNIPKRSHFYNFKSELVNYFQVTKKVRSLLNHVFSSMRICWRALIVD